ncbi:MAG: hypothetical protein AB2L24_24805 [Mangrovibacterium sp.]
MLFRTRSQVYGKQHELDDAANNLLKYHYINATLILAHERALHRLTSDTHIS